MSYNRQNRQDTLNRCYLHAEQRLLQVSKELQEYGAMLSWPDAHRDPEIWTNLSAKIQELIEELAEAGDELVDLETALRTFCDP